MRAALLLALLAWVAACGPRNEALYPQAVGAAAFGVAAAGVHRAATGYCWADCQMGTRCNRETGVCEKVPEEKVEPASPPPAPVPEPPAASALASAAAAASASASAPPPSPNGLCRTACAAGELCVLQPAGDYACEKR